MHEKIMNIVANHFNVPMKGMVGKSRVAKTIRARFVSMYFIRKYLGYTYKHIGNIFGETHHSTVLAAIRVIDNSIECQD